MTEWKRQLVLDLNEDTTIAGGTWMIYTPLFDGAGIHIDSKMVPREAKPEEWDELLVSAAGVEKANVQAAHSQIAEMQREIKNLQTLVTAKDNYILSLEERVGLISQFAADSLKTAGTARNTHDEAVKVT